jgi:hypothetical protein
MSDTEQDDQQDSKIVVDTDWKEQVAREKEAPSESTEAPSESTEAPSESTEAPESDHGREEKTVVTETAGDPVADRGDDDMPPPPPASFDVLVSMLFTQAMAFLGQIPDPASQATKINKSYAKHYIDTLEMLGEKTKGNLADDENKMLSEALHALRMMYVNVKA